MLKGQNREVQFGVLIALCIMGAVGAVLTGALLLALALFVGALLLAVNNSCHRILEATEKTNRLIRKMNTLLDSRREEPHPKNESHEQSGG
jgi:hypothetical protein